MFRPVTVATKPEWFISFTEEASKFKWTYLLKGKDYAIILHVFKLFSTTIERQFYASILKFQFDCGIEYTNSAVKTFLFEYDIQIAYTDADNFQAHDVVERLNMILGNDYCTVMNSVKLPHHLWYYTVQYAHIIRNFIYNNAMEDSPRSKVGLLVFNWKLLPSFGQPVIINLNRIASKFCVKGEKVLLWFLIRNFTVTYSTFHSNVKWHPLSILSPLKMILMSMKTRSIVTLFLITSSFMPNFDNNTSTHGKIEGVTLNNIVPSVLLIPLVQLFYHLL